MPCGEEEKIVTLIADIVGIAKVQSELAVVER